MPEHAIASLGGIKLKMLRSEGETALKNLQEARRRHGQVLERAIRLADMNKTEAAYELGEGLGLEKVSSSQVSAWVAGTEHAQTWRFQQHPRLGPALLLAQAEDESGVVVRHVIEVPQKASA